MSEVSKTVSKPQLRGLLHTQAKKHIFIGLGLSIITGIAFKMLICEPRKQRYAEFYKKYDGEAEYKRMKALGLFQSG